MTEPGRTRPVLAAILLGIATGIFLHYVLYRLALPVTPFVYVAF